MTARTEAVMLWAGLALATVGVSPPPDAGPALRRCVGAVGLVGYRDGPCAVDGSALRAGVAPPVTTAARADATARARCERAPRDAARQRDRDRDRLDFRARPDLDARVARARRR